MASSDPPSSLAKPATRGLVWRGDEHRLQVEAASEAGLATHDVEVDLYTQGFKSGLTLHDEFDGALVLRGRTVLNAHELRQAMAPTLDFLKLQDDDVSIGVLAGDFEIRVHGEIAESSAPATFAVRAALKLWFWAGMLGLVAYMTLPLGGALIWMVGFLVGLNQMRKGATTGRATLAARLTMALAMLAAEEQLILPPSKPAEV